MKFVCSVCGYVHEGDAAPEKCPVCNVPAEKFVAQGGEREWAAEHVVGVAQGVSEDILEDLRANFAGECSEVGMYLAMARVAHREGYPEIGLYWEKAAWEEAEHAAKSNLPAVAPFSASTLSSRFFFVESVTTSPNNSANLAACSASSQAAFSQYKPISGYPSL